MKALSNEFSSIIENNDTITLRPPTEIICGKAVDYDQESLINESYEVSLTSSVCGEDNADVNPCITNIESDITHPCSNSIEKKVGLKTMFDFYHNISYSTFKSYRF